MKDVAQVRLLRQPRSLLFLVACVSLPWLLTLLAYLVDLLLFLISLGHVGSHTPWCHRSALSRSLDRYACIIYDALGIPRTPLQLPRTLRNGVTRAKKLVRPFLHIETELESESDASEENILTPTSLRLVSKAQHKRAMLNATIRDCLRHVAAEELQSVFRVQTCTWNVGQTAPPPFSRGFLEWLLGAELTTRLASYQASSAETKGAAAADTVSLDSSVQSDHSINASIKSKNSKAGGDVADATPALQSLLNDFPDMIVITLQEVDMGGVALVRESTNSSIVWAEAITSALHRAAHGKLQYRKLKMVQLVGLVLLVLVQAKHVNCIAHVRLSLTRTGAMRMLGNKGSVSMRATVYGKRFLFVAAHFVAHKHNERRRTRNYHAALRDIRFDMPFGTDDESDVLCTFVDANAVTSNASAAFVKGRSAWDRLTTLLSLTRRLSGEVERRALDQHDYVFFLGDLNSRLHSVSSTEIHRRVREQAFDYLLCHDELRQGMVSGAIFDGFQEAAIEFAPTYKFDPGTDRYDTSRKRRDPAWCDRILFRVLQPPLEWVVAMMGQRNGSTLHAVAGPVVVHTTNNSYALGREGRHAMEKEKKEKADTSSHATAHAPAVDDGNLQESKNEERGVDVGSRKSAAPQRKTRKAPWLELSSIAPTGTNEEKDEEEELASSIYTTASTSTSSGSNNSSTHSRSSTSSGRSKSSVSGCTRREQQQQGAAIATTSARHARTAKRSRTETAVGTHKTSSTSSSSFTATTMTTTIEQSKPETSQSLPTSSTSSPLRRGLSEGTFHAVRQPWRSNEVVPRFPMMMNAAEVLTYYSVDSLRQSDHRPVAAQFEVKVIRLDTSVVNEVQNCVRARLQCDEEPATTTTATGDEKPHSLSTRLLEVLEA